MVTCKQKERLRDNTGFPVTDKLQSHWTCTHHSLVGRVQTKVTASPIVVGTRIGTCTTKNKGLSFIHENGTTAIVLQLIQHLINDAVWTNYISTKTEHITQNAFLWHQNHENISHEGTWWIFQTPKGKLPYF